MTLPSHRTAVIAAAVVGAIVVGMAILGPILSRASKRRKAIALMPRWPDDWPDYGEFLSGRLPGWTWLPPLRGIPVSAWPGVLGRWLLQLVTMGVRPPDLTFRGVARWLVDVFYWGPRRLHWRAPGGFYALPSGRYAMGTAAARLGLLQPRNWLERKCPLEIWMPRDMLYRHFGLAGPTGSGKTTTLGIALPFYAAYGNQTVIINDVKLANGGAEYFAWFVDHWRRHGRAAYNFNPWTPDETLACEPIHAATREQVDIIVAALIKAAKSGKGADSGTTGFEFFNNAARQLLTALVLGLRYAPRRYCSLPTLFRVTAMGARAITEFLADITAHYPPLETTEAAIRRLLDVPDAQLEAAWLAADGARQQRADDVTTALAVVDRSGYEIQQWVAEARRTLWHRGERIAAPEDVGDVRWKVLRQLYHHRHAAFEEAIGNLGTVIEQPEQTFANIIMTMQNALSPFQAADVQRAFARPEFFLADVVNQPSLFIIGAPQAKWDVGAKFTATMFWNLVINLVYERGRNAAIDHTRNVDVLALMDEMPALGLESLAQVLATVRSYKMGVLGVFQSDHQLKEGWGDNYGTVLDNMVQAATLFGSGGETAKRTAERAGKAVMLKENRSTSTQGMGFNMAGNSTSVATTAERVERMTEQDVTEMRVNGRTQGDKTAIFTGKNAAPFLFSQIPWWDDPVIRDYLDASFHPSRGQWKLPENRHPFIRAPWFEVENPRRKSREEPWVFRTDATGQRIPDAHAHDKYRDTVDLIAPHPDGTTLYELRDSVFDPTELGITPVTTEHLQATVAKKLGQQAAVPAAAPAPKPTAGSTSAPVGTAALRTHLAVLDELLESDAGLPNYTPMPALNWEDRRHSWYEIAESIQRAECERHYVIPKGPVPGLHLEVETVNLEWYMANAVHSVLDFPSFVFKWVKKPGVAPSTPAEVQAVIANACDLHEHLAGGIAASPLVWGPYLELADVAPAGVRDALRRCLDRVRDRLAAATAPEVLVSIWADVRGELMEVVPPDLDATVARLFVHAEALVDYGTLTRAQHLDLQRFGDDAQSALPQFTAFLASNQYLMPAREAIRAQMENGAELRTAIERYPHRKAAAARLSDAVAHYRALEEVHTALRGVPAVSAT
jgi:type IV secretory pathway TraG/TraD family ATPase VirD4